MEEDTAICPVCGKEVPTEDMGNYTRRRHGKTFRMCGTDCRDEFDNDPSKYAPDPNW